MLTYARQIFNLKNENAQHRKMYKWHLFAWACFIIYEAFAVGLALGSFGKLRFYLLHYSINILLFYTHSEIVLPFSTFERIHIKWKLPLFIAIEVTLYLLINYVTDYVISYYSIDLDAGDIKFDERFVYGGIWRSVYFIGFASAYYYLRYYLKERDNRERLEKSALEKKIEEKEVAIELNRAKNAYLKAQINPHFLFNTINFIYSKIHKSDPDAGKALVHLSKIIRFALDSEHGPDFAPLAKEIEQIRILVELWELRQGDEVVNFILDIHPDTEKINFIPLVLLTLIENIFKHGNLSLESDPAVMSIRKENDKLIVETNNLINTGINDTGYHTGLNNIEQRLALTYGHEASFSYHRTDEAHFRVKLVSPLGSKK